MGSYLCPTCVWPVSGEISVTPEGQRLFICDKCNRQIPERESVLVTGPEWNPRIWDTVRKSLRILKNQLKQ